MPVEVLGFDGIPGAGDPFQVTASERDSKDFSEKRQELKKQEEAKNVKKVTLANLYSTIQAGEVQELKVIIKGDVHGSVEALQVALEKLSTAEVRLSAIHAAAGAIIEQDVTLATLYKICVYICFVDIANWFSFYVRSIVICVSLSNSHPDVIGRSFP